MAHFSYRPIGYFCHHQGRGHAMRAAAILNALPKARPAQLFCARGDIFPPLRAGIDICVIPSLFEPTGDEATNLAALPQPDTVHCAPLGWPGIRSAMRQIAQWFDEANPALMISDVSAEIAQLARLCSVPHVCVLQHGDRTDPGHRAAYDGAVGLIAPFAEDLAQPDWPEQDRAKTVFAGGLGVETAVQPTNPPSRPHVLVVSGGGGQGLSEAPLAVAARTYPEFDWITVGQIQRDWHATPPGNLIHAGWVDDVADRIASASLVVASTGNTTCQQVLAAGKPWIAVPEWRYFDEQVCKARALDAAGVARHVPHLPASAAAWRDAVDSCLSGHDAARQTSLIEADAASKTAAWIEAQIAALWGLEASPFSQKEPVMQNPSCSVVTIARGRDAHLSNVILGLTKQTTMPKEMVIGVMQNALYRNLPDAPFPIRQIKINAGDTLPLAAARNAAANAATGDMLIFLDVDCIPAPDLVADYTAALGSVRSGLVMGEVMYLPGGATEDGVDYPAFEALAERHSDRRGPPKEGQEPCNDYRCFWSLSFAMSHSDWQASGGFDESFTGYGGEDTDFGRTLDEMGMPIWWTKGARAYHQYHPHAMPPVHHLRSVLRNAERFAEKWGHRTMEHWLHAFRLMGLIENGPDGLRVLREPGPSDFALCHQQSDQPYASTRVVIDQLQRVSGSDRYGATRTAQVEADQADMLRVAAE